MATKRIISPRQNKNTSKPKQKKRRPSSTARAKMVRAGKAQEEMGKMSTTRIGTPRTTEPRIFSVISKRSNRSYLERNNNHFLHTKMKIRILIVVINQRKSIGNLHSEENMTTPKQSTSLGNTVGTEVYRR